MTELSQLLLDTESFQELMVQLAELSARTVPGVKTCGITMAKDEGVVTVGAADALADQLVSSSTNWTRGRACRRCASRPSSTQPI